MKFLTNDLVQRIISEARDILCKPGIKIYDKQLRLLLSGYGAHVEEGGQQVCFTNDLIDKALKTVPSSFKLYDVMGNETHHFSRDQVYFTPASSALSILDTDMEHGTAGIREPTTNDYTRYVKVVNQLKHIASQSTAFIPADVSEKISDSYRLYLNLLYGEKPVVTGTFSDNGFPIMKDFQVVVRGTEKELKEKPLTIFSCCSTTPLKWGERSCQDIINCGRFGIPVELISMPLAGFTGPVTLVGSLVGHTAENLSGIVISQLSAPGAPLLYGGAAAAFDMRYGTTPLGAVESQMMACAYNEIGKYLGIPTQAYIALSDAKALDAQAGLETSMGAALAALSGINNISGPGMLEFVNCFSIEKLVLDNEICGMTFRMLNGIEPKEDIPTLPLYRELLKEQHLLTSQHTRRYFKKEHYSPGKVIDRTSRTKWQEQGSLTLIKQAQAEVERLINTYQPSSLSQDIKNQLTKIMESEARRCGMEGLPKIKENQ
ncbi:MAG: trimethylamine methyltransferase family protein [Candidatus Aminicenantes bacterium]|nr:MAG: trimethylamine methyltransferase family protein [Candidatus Aminicenantes bacterium]